MQNMEQIQVYESEKSIAHLIKANSLAFICQAKTASTNPPPNLVQTVKAMTTAPNLESGDLYYFNSILVSTGWNKNDDVFTQKEIWNAKSTPVDKKINFMHNELDIIGHMISSQVCGQDGLCLDDGTPEEKVPTNLDIVVGGVLYKVWDAPEVQERMNKILAQIESNEMYVSMECLFNNFDYAVIQPDGSHKIIERNATTAFLSKHLRSYGGTGEYEGHKIGRLLRNMVFSGKGLVDNPANPRSTILRAFTGSKASVDDISKMEKIMTITQEQYDAVVKRLETAEASAKAAADKVYETEITSLKAKISTLETEKSAVASDLAVAKEVAKANEDAVAKLEERIKTLQSELTAASNELSTFKSEKLKASRLSQLSDLVDVSYATEVVDKFLDIADEKFAELVSALKKCAKKDEKPEDKTMCADKTVVTPESALASATVEPVVTVIHDADKETTLAKASTWLGSLLKSTANKGE